MERNPTSQLRVVCSIIVPIIQEEQIHYSNHSYILQEVGSYITCVPIIAETDRSLSSSSTDRSIKVNVLQYYSFSLFSQIYYHAIRDLKISDFSFISLLARYLFFLSLLLPLLILFHYGIQTHSIEILVIVVALYLVVVGSSFIVFIFRRQIPTISTCNKIGCSGPNPTNKFFLQSIGIYKSHKE